MPTPERLRTLRAVLERRQEDLQVVLDNLHDSHNASAVLRTCDGFGVGTVHLLSTDNPLPEISKGVSGYTRKWLEMPSYKSTRACVSVLKAEGLRIVATHVDDSARSYLEIDWTEPVALVLGNEHRGCTEEMLAEADERVKVPMQGMAQSFNVSVSAGILLGEAYRQRMAAGRYEASWSEGKERLYQQWLERDEVG